jgi:hypothetical protein
MPMAIDDQRRSDNFEDITTYPGKWQDQIIAALGMERGPVDTFKSFIEAMKHPMTQSPGAITPYNASKFMDYGPQPDTVPTGSLPDQAGVNDIVRALRGGGQ